MENSIKTDEIYEVKFEQLVETEKQQLSAVNDIMEGLMDVSVSMGSAPHIFAWPVQRQSLFSVRRSQRK